MELVKRSPIYSHSLVTTKQNVKILDNYFRGCYGNGKILPVCITIQYIGSCFYKETNSKLCRHDDDHDQLLTKKLKICHLEIQ